MQPATVSQEQGEPTVVNPAIVSSAEPSLTNGMGLAVRVPLPPALVPVSVAKFLTGLTRERLREGVQEGRWLWVWDVAIPGSRIQELRWFAPELGIPEAFRSATVDTILWELFPYEVRTHIPAREFCAKLDVSRPHVCLLVSTGSVAGTVRGHTLWLSLPSVCEFLKQRLASAG